MNTVDGNMENEKIKKLEKRIKVLEKAYKKKNNKNGMLWGIVIILFVVLICTQIEYFQVDDNHVGLVLAFVGILATFVVISNYSQLKTMEDKHSAMDDRFETAIKDISRVEITIDNTVKELNSLSNMNFALSMATMFKEVKAYEAAIHWFFLSLESINELEDRNVLKSRNQRIILSSIYYIIQDFINADSEALEDSDIDNYMSIIQNVKISDKVEERNFISRFLFDSKGKFSKRLFDNDK